MGVWKESGKKSSFHFNLYMVLIEQWQLTVLDVASCLTNSNIIFSAENSFGIFYFVHQYAVFHFKLFTFTEYEIYVSQHHWCLKSSLSVCLHLQRGACSFSSPLSFGLVMIPGMSINSKSGTCLPNLPRRPECKSKSAK